MTGTILIGLGCFALGAVVGWYAGWRFVVHAITHNTKGFADWLSAFLVGLAELRAKKGAK